MADAKLKIVIDAVNNAKAELDTLKKQLEGVEAPSKRASTSLGDIGKALGLVGAAAYGTVAALKQVYAAGLQGAEQAQMEESFNRLGVSMDELMEKSRGTVDDFDLMAATLKMASGASEDLQAKLLQNAPQLLEIAKAANKMNPALGDTGALYESIAEAIKRVTPRQLASLGLTIKTEDANRAYAESIGKSADALTTEEQQMALLNATMLAGDRLMEQVGGNVDAQTDKYLQLALQLDDASDSIHKLANTMTGPFVLALGRGAKATMEAIDGMGALRVLVPLLAGDYGSFMTALTETNTAQEDAANAARANAAETSRLTGLAEEYAEQQRLANIATYDAAVAGQDSAGAFEAYSAALDQGAASITAVYDASNAARDALAGYALSQQAASDSAAIAAINFYNTAAALGEMSIATFAQEQLAALKEELDNGTISQDQYKQATEAILTQFGLLTQAEQNAQGDIAALRQAFLDGKITAQQFADMLAIIKGNLDALEDKTVNVRMIYTEEHRSQGAGAGQSSENYVPPQAVGGVAGGGWTMVGERGPELVNLPGGAHVMSNPVTNNVVNNYNLNMHTRATSGTVRQDFALLRALG